jgi:glutathione reductase (NADPH)
MSEEYDVVTIGAGSGGTRASRMVAKIPGKRVAVIELPFGLVSTKEVGGAGGTCVIRGCVPKKLLVYASSFQADFRDAGGYGWDDISPGGYALKKMMEKKAAEVERLNGIYGRLLKNAGCDYIEGYGKILDPHTVEVTAPDGTKRELKTKNILVATGGRAFVPDIPGKELCDTSDEALVYNKVPETLVIVGGGYISVEFAGIYAGFGSKVHLICRRELPLRGFDKECRELVLKNLEARGIVFHANTTPASIEKVGTDKLAVTINAADGTSQVIQADKCMFATGRKPNVENLGLENVAVELGPNKAIKVNNILQTSVPSIWALGDVIDKIQLTPVALMEGMAFTETMKGNPKEPDYTCVASAVFCQPPLATVGISEEEAIETHVGEIDVFVEGFRPMKNTISGREERSLMKLVVDTATDRVLGAHMVGPDSAEIMQGIAVALKCGATKAQFDSTIGIHPSSAEEFVTMRTMARRVKCKGTATAPSPSKI